MKFKYGDIVITEVTWTGGEIVSELAFEFSHYELDINLVPCGVFAVVGTVHKVTYPKDDKAPIAFRLVESFNYDSPFSSAKAASERLKYYFDRRKGI